MTTLCFTELITANAVSTKQFHLVYPDALYVNTTCTFTSITGTRESGYDYALYLESSHPVKKEHQNSPAALSSTAILNEDHSQRKKSRKKYPSATGKDHSLYRHDSLSQRLCKTKMPP